MNVEAVARVGPQHYRKEISNGIPCNLDARQIIHILKEIR